MHWEYVYNLMIFADSLVESLFPALVFGIYCKWATRKAAITSISVGAIIICLTFFVWDLGYVWYGTIGLATAFVLMYVVSKLTKDDPKDSEDFTRRLTPVTDASCASKQKSSNGRRAKSMIRFTLNGTQIEVQDGENRTLLEYLRNVKCMKAQKKPAAPVTAARAAYWWTAG